MYIPTYQQININLHSIFLDENHIVSGSGGHLILLTQGLHMFVRKVRCELYISTKGHFSKYHDVGATSSKIILKLGHFWHDFKHVKSK